MERKHYPGPKGQVIEGWIANPELADEGFQMIEIAREDMPAVQAIVAKHKERQPLAGARISICVIPTPETAVMAIALQELGAQVRLCSDNVVSVDDRVAAALVASGIPTFGKRDQSVQDFYNCIGEALRFIDENGHELPPTQIIDDGSDMTKYLHQLNPPWIDHIVGITEQTTCGVQFAGTLAKAGVLKPPVVDINSGLKSAVDNRYGPRQSFITSFETCKKMSLGGKTVVVAGYGQVGQGVVEALQAVGAIVKVTEVDPIRAAHALLNGVEVVRMDDVIDLADIIITAAACPSIVNVNQIQRMKSGATLGNMGENRQYDAHSLVKVGYEKRQVNPNLVRYQKADHYIDSCVDGFLMNMRTGGNPPKVLDITFALHMLVHLRLADGWPPTRGTIHALPEGIEQQVALLAFPKLNGNMTTLTDDQEKYMGRGINNGDTPFCLTEPSI